MVQYLITFWFDEVQYLLRLYSCSAISHDSFSILIRTTQDVHSRESSKIHNHNVLTCRRSEVSRVASQ